MSTGTIGRQTSSYRQGLVLGLTMAEIMLLLVFCLLIAVGVALSTERAKRDDALLRLQKVESAAALNEASLKNIRQNARLMELMDRAARLASQRQIDDFWRKLVESNDMVARMEQQGVPLASLEDEGPNAAKLRQLLNEGIDPDNVARNQALAAAIDAVLADKNLANLTPQQIAALLGRGIDAPKPTEEANNKKGHNWPPIINLSEAGGYYFATGSAELTPSFATELRTVVVDKLLEIAESYDVDVIEVIGHTDEQPVNGRSSNLDRSLSLVTTGGGGAGILQWADNAGLGLARALSVVERLSADSRLRNFRILPLSGAQLIGIDGRLTRWDGHGDVRERRRIEIRMRKSV
jgi:outer membrane protein OmpA-like peptidoglycan-associated protein